MNPDIICEKYKDRKIKLKAQVKKNMVIIEGDKTTLEFFGKLVLAQAQFKKDCGFQISPDGAGKIFFHKKSPLGLYIHRLPCTSKK